jgi:hypothetical protein
VFSTIANPAISIDILLKKVEAGLSVMDF